MHIQLKMPWILALVALLSACATERIQPGPASGHRGQKPDQLKIKELACVPVVSMKTARRQTLSRQITDKSPAQERIRPHALWDSRGKNRVMLIPAKELNLTRNEDASRLFEKTILVCLVPQVADPSLFFPRRDPPNKMLAGGLNSNPKVIPLIGLLPYVMAVNPDRSQVLQGMPVHRQRSGNLPIHSLWLYLSAGLSGLLSFLAIRFKPDIAETVSAWAALHPVKTRFLIGVTQVGCGCAGLLLGFTLARNGTVIPDNHRNALLAVFFGATLLYPVRKTLMKFLKRTYFREKVLDVVLFVTGALLMIQTGNHYYNQNVRGYSYRSMNIQADYKQKPVLEDRIRTLSHDVFQQQDPSQDKPAKPPRKPISRGGKVALIFVTILMGVLMGWGIAVLSCSLACSGLNGLAVLVAIGGAALIAGLMVMIIKAIAARPLKPEKMPIPDPQ